MSDDLCEVCKINKFKYKCPGCLKKTCSLECSKKHKKDDSCSGQSYNPLKYVSSGTLKSADDEKHENNYLVQRDYNFLTNIKRQLEIQKLDGKTKNKRTLHNGNNNNNANSCVKRARVEEECSRVIRRGVNCLLLPRGMQRSILNKSRWDKNLDLFVWTVDWVVCPDKLNPSAIEELRTPFMHVSHKIKETATLFEGMSNVIFEKCCQIYNLTKDEDNGPLDEKCETDQHGVVKYSRDNKEREQILLKNGLKFYTKQFPYNNTQMQDSKELVELDASNKCIGELFRNRTVIEFPTIYVAKRLEDLPSGFKVVEDNVKVNVPKSQTQESSNPISQEENREIPGQKQETKDVDADDDNNEEPEEESIFTNDLGSNKLTENVTVSVNIPKVEDPTKEESEDDYDPVAL